MPTSRSTSEADAFLAAHPDAETVDMVIADMNGILRGKQLARNYLKKLYSDGVRLPGSNYLLDWTGQNVTSLSYGTADGDPDYFCFPVKGTLKSVPWSLRPSGQVLASMYHEDGTPWFADPRHILARAMQPLADMGLTPVVAIEYEFYLIDQKAAAEGVVRPAASPQSGWRSTTTSVYALDDLYDFEELLGDIHEACALQGIPAETFVKEYAPGQFEINLHHIADPLEACDQAILLERAIKQVARRHGVIATFMAKPFADRVGSGLHVHVSLVDRDGRNVFAGPTDSKIGRPISDTLRQAIGGLLATMPEAMAIFAPNANSYRRLRPGTYAPVRGLWGGDNRTVPLRIPGGGEESVRIEHRVAGADANPYLVVAADRGTATFSDLANSIATEEFSFWLGDAFASGGSAGYDHKVLGITAKGAWECTLRHFKEIGIDVNAQEFTVVGIGDMSGDVFGNGLLQSDNAKLVAAFDHRHIFIDPDPDPKRSYAERLRLFQLPRSNWADYDKSLLSAGACIVSRDEKEIRISPEAQAALGTSREVFSSTALIQTILKAPVDLLWNGGIGTYVKATGESHLDAEDRGNDDVRVDAKDLRVRIVAEGGNLGFTQLGRIEYAKVGGHINTDAVDNSGGVDMSDFEVNLKLLFREALLDGSMTFEARNEILRSCEDEACEKVLARNRSQSLVLSLAVRRSRSNLNFYEALISSFEKEGRLSAAADFLPDEETFEKRRIAKAGLCRPELAILIAHTKMAAYESILESDLPDEPFLRRYLLAYFPRSITEKFSEMLDSHALKREIIATQVANVLVERMGSSFVYRLSMEAGASITNIIRAFIVADTIFNGHDLVRNLSVLDRANTSRFYLLALLRIQSALESISRWFLDEDTRHVSIGQLVDRYRASFQQLLLQTENILSTGEQNRYQETVRELLIHGVPRELAKSIGASQYATVYLDIIQVAEDVRREPTEIAILYAQLASELQVGGLIDAATHITSEDKWEALAIKTLSINLRLSIAKLCRTIIMEHDGFDEESLERYFFERKPILERYKASLNEVIKSTPAISSLMILSNLLDTLGRPLPQS